MHSAGELSSHGTLAEPHLADLCELLGRLKAQRNAYTNRPGRVRQFLVISSAPVLEWSGCYPGNPHTHTWLDSEPEGALEMADGIFRGLSALMASEMRDCRRAEEVVQGGDVSADEAPLSWEELELSEQALCPPVLVVAEAEPASSDPLWQCRGPIKLVTLHRDCLGYDGRPTCTAPTLQCSIGYPGHLMHAVAEGVEQPGPAWFRVYAPEPHISGIAASKAPVMARLATDSRAFPLVRYTPGASVQFEGNPDPDETWTNQELTFTEPSGNESRLITPLTVADWAVHEGRYREHFSFLSKGHLASHMKPLAEYLALAPAERHDVTPFIHVADAQDRHILAIPDSQMVRWVEEKSEEWRTRQGTILEPRLPELTGAPKPPEPIQEPGEPAGKDADLHARLTERLLDLAGYSSDPEFFRQSLRHFVTTHSRNGEGES